MKQKIELLAPAKNKDIGIAAIRHGADAVYIGAQTFGARSAAGNSIGDIEELTKFAHLYHAKVYVTLNTILKDEELPQAEALINELYAIGVDALIVQDMALLRLNLPPIDLHASTQTHNTTPEKVSFLEAMGYSQVVLARELSLPQITEIHSKCKVKLEAFVHGALCVSYSGRCYASEYCFSRSANRGCCAQFCRLPFTLIDGKGRKVAEEQHLLSLRDMNRSQSLEAMLDAGITSFKIEGRLKDENYVKNVTAFYRRAIDEIIVRRSEEFERSSHGKVYIAFTPDLTKSFNRGFTDYFLHDKRTEMHNFITPKSMGEPVGRVIKSGRKHLEVDTTATFSAGDGLSFTDNNGRLQGFRVNSVSGNCIFPHIMPAVSQGAILYRNHDEAFSKLLAREKTERKISVDMCLKEVSDGFRLTLADEVGFGSTTDFVFDKTPANTPQEANIRKQLARLGDSIFELQTLRIEMENNWFIPSSLLAAWRRGAVDALMSARENARPRQLRLSEDLSAKLPYTDCDYTENIFNRKALSFYESHGACNTVPAFEKEQPRGATLMFTKYCLRDAMGCCLKKKGEETLPAPLTLRLSDGKSFALDFDCKACEMRISAKD